MEERSSFRLGDEISEFKSLNLRELMKENDEHEIREVPSENDSAERRTMGEILGGAVGKSLWEVIQSEQSKVWEHPVKGREIAGSRLLKNVFRVKKKFQQEDEETANLLGAHRSPSLVDSARLRAAAGDEAAAIRVFLVGQSPSDTMDGIGAHPRVRWGFLKEKLRLRNIACCGSSWNFVTEQSNLNSAVPVVLPPTEELNDAISWSNSGPLQEQNGNINGPAASETDGDISQSRPEGCVNVDSPADSGEVNSAPTDRPAERRQLITLFESNLEEPNETMQGSMNLAAALAAERQLRATQNWDSNGSANRNAAITSDATAPDQVGSGGSAFRVSLMSLLEEADERISRQVSNGRSDATRASRLLTDGWEETQPTEGVDPLCCVCMVRRKGAAFIPCGHTFCRFCSRELWVSRGSCPLCNRFIMEILDIF